MQKNSHIYGQRKERSYGHYLRSKKKNFDTLACKGFKMRARSRGIPLQHYRSSKEVRLETSQKNPVFQAKNGYFRPKDLTRVCFMISNSVEILWDSVTYSILSLAKKIEKKTFFRPKMAIFGYFWPKNLTRACFMIGNAF